MIEQAPAFVDTGAWYALSDRRDSHHQRAVSTFRNLLRDLRPLITTNLVIAESYTLISRGGGHQRATEFLRMLRASNHVRVVYLDVELEAVAAGILAQYDDQPFSYVDAVSFAVMRRERILHAFAFDRHVTIAGFTLVPAA